MDTNSSNASTRRPFLKSGMAALAAGAAAYLGLRPKPVVAAGTFPVTKPDAEWKKQLSPAQYSVLREEGTERPFSSPLNNEHREGKFSCAGCKIDLFSSKTKFDSGTGWPSFWKPVDKAVVEVKD